MSPLPWWFEHKADSRIRHCIWHFLHMNSIVWIKGFMYEILQSSLPLAQLPSFCEAWIQQRCFRSSNCIVLPITMSYLLDKLLHLDLLSIMLSLCDKWRRMTFFYNVVLYLLINNYVINILLCSTISAYYLGSLWSLTIATVISQWH